MSGRDIRLSLRGSSMALSAVLAVLIAFFASAAPSTASASHAFPSCAAGSVTVYDLAPAPCATHARSCVDETASAAANPVEDDPSARPQALHGDRLRDGFPDSLHTFYVLAGGTSGAAVLVHNKIPCPPNLDALAKSGTAEVGNQGVWKVAASLEQHAADLGLSKAAFPKGVHARNRFAMDYLEDILTNPRTRFESITSGQAKGGIYAILNGRGAAFNSQGIFRYFGALK